MADSLVEQVGYRWRMARVEYPDAEAPAARQMVEEIRKQRSGRFPHLFHMQLYNPAVADGWLRLGTAVRYKSELDGLTREMAICLVARLTGAEYEWLAHSRLAAEEGLSKQQLDGILDWQQPNLFSDQQRAVLAFTQALTTAVQVDDATFDALRPLLSERQLVELVTVVSYYNMVSRFLVGLKIDLE
jgi:alkylhydroperoxidase family enzyme